MAILTRRGISTAIRILGRIDKKYNVNKIFIEKYVPPGYRKIVGQIYDVGLTGALIYNVIDQLTGNNAVPSQINVPKTDKFSKTYSRNQQYNRRYNKYCPPNYGRQRRYVYPSRRKRSTYRR